MFWKQFVIVYRSTKCKVSDFSTLNLHSKSLGTRNGDERDTPTNIREILPLQTRSYIVFYSVGNSRKIIPLFLTTTLRRLFFYYSGLRMSPSSTLVQIPHGPTIRVSPFSCKHQKESVYCSRRTISHDCVLLLNLTHCMTFPHPPFLPYFNGQSRML